jgi:hypothetical protein
MLDSWEGLLAETVVSRKIETNRMPDNFIIFITELDTIFDYKDSFYK